MISSSIIQGCIKIFSKSNHKFLWDFCDLPVRSHLNGMPFFPLLTNFVGTLPSSFIFLHYTRLHFQEFHIAKKLITNKYIPLIIKIIFRIVIVADCKSTIQFLHLDVRYTGVYLCYCSDRVLYKWRLFLNVLLCCSGWVALLFVVSNSHDTGNCTLLGYYAGSSGNILLTFRDNLSVPSWRA